MCKGSICVCAFHLFWQPSIYIYIMVDDSCLLFGMGGQDVVWKSHEVCLFPGGLSHGAWRWPQATMGSLKPHWWWLTGAFLRCWHSYHIPGHACASPVPGQLCSWSLGLNIPHLYDHLISFMWQCYFNLCDAEGMLHILESWEFVCLPTELAWKQIFIQKCWILCLNFIWTKFVL